MVTGKIRVIDILTDQELMEIEECEANIIMARSPFEIRKNRERALELLARARARYAAKHITVVSSSTTPFNHKEKGNPNY
ncbi:hypothetical protein M3152_01455 [Sporosarcina luteola]|uniref:hypothetical protein n=1 Tax=Sporosarcina luteola TaxID=582850 RepID=UPI0020412290|nr:hypothetical protein [Sporosarcina luteola]MCM3636367.1 hypothetical protein [Sporosarcina luteola]